MCFRKEDLAAMNDVVNAPTMKGSDSNGLKTEFEVCKKEMFDKKK